MKKLLLTTLCSFVAISSLMGMDGKQKAPYNQEPSKVTVIAMDLDDVMSIKQKPGTADFLLLARALFWNPKVLLALLNIKALQEEGAAVGKTVNGACNTVHAMLEKLKERGYGDLFCYENEIVAGATKPKPMPGMVEAIQQLKRDGHLVIGATNHDWKQNLAYRNKMKAQGVDLNGLFDAVVTTRVNHVQQPATQKASLFDRPVAGENIYSARLQKAFKPNKSYYLTLKKVAATVATEQGKRVERIIFTDDTQGNVHAAQQAGIDAIHFDLGGVSARKKSSEEIDQVVATWKRTLAQLLNN